MSLFNTPKVGIELPSVRTLPSATPVSLEMNRSTDVSTPQRSVSSNIHAYVIEVTDLPPTQLLREVQIHESRLANEQEQVQFLTPGQRLQVRIRRCSSGTLTSLHDNTSGCLRVIKETCETQNPITNRDNRICLNGIIGSSAPSVPAILYCPTAEAIGVVVMSNIICFVFSLICDESQHIQPSLHRVYPEN